MTFNKMLTFWKLKGAVRDVTTPSYINHKKVKVKLTDNNSVYITYIENDEELVPLRLSMYTTGNPSGTEFYVKDSMRFNTPATMAFLKEHI